jgi:dihydroorotase/N-acyl-D-amino-acid deacylase
MRAPIALLLAMFTAACAASSDGAARIAAGPPYDLVIANGQVVDGSGNPWFYGDVAVKNGRIARVTPAGLLKDADAKQRVNASGLVVAPGFIDIQAQSVDELTSGDSRVVSMTTQGVTTMIMGEGSTPAPSNDKIMELYRVTDSADKALFKSFEGPHGFGNWIAQMEKHKTSVNFGSFIGTATVRTYAKGQAEGAPTAAELDTMRAVVRRAMEDGAFGIASALIYPPDNYSSTADLVEMAKAMAPYGGV